MSFAQSIFPRMPLFGRSLALVATLIVTPALAEVPVKEITTPGGIKAWLVEAPEIPFLALELRFKGGATLDPAGKEGATVLMAGLLEEGTGDLDAQGFAAARDKLAASIGFGAQKEEISVSSRFLTENRDEAVELIRRALVEPSFPEDAVARVKGQILSGLAAEEKDPSALAGRAFAKLAFGDHPYGRPTEGTKDSVTALTLEDIRAAHKAAIARDRVHVAAVGDITEADLAALLDKLLGGLPETGAPFVGTAPFGLTGQIDVTPFPGPQSVILFGQEGLPQDDPDYIPAFVLTEIIGGGRFGTRLMTEVREKRGLTYGIGAGLSNYDQASLLAGQVQTANHTAKETIEVIRAEWAKAADVTEAELEAVKTYLTGAYPLRWDGNSNIARQLVSLQKSGYGVDYPATRNAKVEAVTLEDVQRVAKRLMKPETLSFVIVGQPDGIEQE